MTRTISQAVETAILHRKMIRDSYVVRAEARHFSPDSGWSSPDEVEYHIPMPMEDYLPIQDMNENMGLPDEELLLPVG